MLMRIIDHVARPIVTLAPPGAMEPMSRERGGEPQDFDKKRFLGSGI